jgi:hypothetical protein
LSTDGIADGVSAGAEVVEVLVDGVELASSLLPQAAVTKSRDKAEAARPTRTMVLDMTKSLCRWKKKAGMAVHFGEYR